MPDRVLRAAIHHSDRFLSLPDHVCRLCFLACISVADDLGNFEASPGNLRRLWRDYGADSPAEVERIRGELAAVDLVRWYELELSTGSGKKLSTGRFGHIPRFRQRIRHVKRGFPRPPADIEDIENNEEADETPDGRPTADSRTPDDRQADARRSTASRAPAESNRIESTSTNALQTPRNSARATTAKKQSAKIAEKANGHDVELERGGPAADWRRNPEAAERYGRSIGAPSMPGESLAAYVARLDRIRAMLGPTGRVHRPMKPP